MEHPLSGKVRTPLAHLKLLRPHCQVRSPAALKSLCGHYLVSMTPQIQASIPPRVNMVGKGDGLVAPGRSLRRPNTPVLIKSSSAFNGRRVDSLGPIYVVCATITANGP
jgi:hypothetical protein